MELIIEGKCANSFKVTDTRIYLILHGEHEISIACNGCVEALKKAIIEYESLSKTQANPEDLSANTSLSKSKTKN